MNIKDSLNAMLDAEVDKLVNADCYARDEQEFENVSVLVAIGVTAGYLFRFPYPLVYFPIPRQKLLWISLKISYPKMCIDK